MDIKSYSKPRLTAHGKAKAVKLTVRKPVYLAKHIISYEVSYRLYGKKSWSKAKSYKYVATKTVTLKHLKKRKSYDVRVRTVKNIGGVKYRSIWTKATVKTK
jgi:hypothetical protein